MRHILVSACGLGLLVAPLAAHADETSPLSPLYDCTSIEAPLERLACLDGAVAELRARESAREVVAIDFETAEELQKDSFGFRLPSLPKLALPKLGGGEEERVELVIASVSRSGGNATFVMENGQVWRQTDGSPKRYFRSKTGTPIVAHIRSATLGSFLMSVEVDGKMRAKGMRVRRIK